MVSFSSRQQWRTAMEIHLRMIGTVIRIEAWATVREASSLPSSAGLSARGRARRAMETMRKMWESSWKVKEVHRMTF